MTRRPGSLFTTAAAALVIGSILLVALLISLASNGSVKSQLGSPTFVPQVPARVFAPQIEATGPFLFPSLWGKRPVYLQHLGPDERTGWFAIQATVPGSTCVLRWTAPSFVDPCSRVSYPADGTGLVRFKTTVLPSDRIEIDLRTPIP